MKLGKMLLFFVISLPLLATVLFLYDTYRMYMYGRTIIPQFGVLIGFFNPPGDYFKPRGKAVLCVEKSEQAIEYTHKYYGGYLLEVKFPGDMEVTEKINSGLSFDCSYYDKDGQLIRHRTLTNLVFHSNGRGSVFGIIDKYDVPKDLSIYGTWNLVVRMYGDVQSFLGANRNITLSIVKSSDE